MPSILPINYSEMPKPVPNLDLKPDLTPLYDLKRGYDHLVVRLQSLSSQVMITSQLQVTHSKYAIVFVKTNGKPLTKITQSIGIMVVHQLQLGSSRVVSQSVVNIQCISTFLFAIRGMAGIYKSLSNQHLVSGMDRVKKVIAYLPSKHGVLWCLGLNFVSLSFIYFYFYFLFWFDIPTCLIFI